ncbi:LuxR C-terminal-related transcriptional regulator [Oscillospiraceae bacterium PP1C4]
MENSLITSSDYEKLLEMALKLGEYRLNFRENTLRTLTELFDYQHVTFLNVDADDNFIHPIGINNTHSLCKLYDSFYRQCDIFCSSNILEVMQNNKLIGIEQIMTFQEYENTPYYNEFLKKGNLYYEVALPLRKGNTTIGAMGFFREKSKKNFTEKDYKILNYISDCVALNYSNAIEFSNIQNSMTNKAAINKKIPCLTERENQIVSLVNVGLSNKEISKELQISFHTVKAHMEQIFSKLNVNNRTSMLYQYHQL